MFIDKTIPPQPHWGYANELDGRDLDLGYPRNLVKAVKAFYYVTKSEGFNNIDKITLHLKSHGYYNLEPLRNNTSEALKYFFIRRETFINAVECPTSEAIVNLFMDHDKYFHMMVTLGDILPKIYRYLKSGLHKMAAIEIGSLIRIYNEEVFELINQYFYSHAKLNPETNKWEYYYTNGHLGFAVSSTPYIAVIIYKVTCEKELTWEVETEKVSLKTLFENYNVLTVPDEDHRIKPSGDFLIDCKKITNLKKEALKSYIGNLDFHDLIMYGYYNDKILSIEVLKKINEIYDNKADWTYTFFLAVSLYCDNYIKIGTEKNEDVGSYLVPLSTSLVDTSKVKNFDKFLEVVAYFNSIYDEIVDKPEKA